MNLTPNHPAVVEGRTIHPKTVKDLSTYKGKVLKSVANNRKLGNGHSVVMKGKWRGMPMFSLTLEERKTCPKSCHHWRDCYGNGMAFAHRFPAGPELEARIESEVSELAKMHQHFLIRLHVLGDFYSIQYVELWERLMHQYPGLYVFGYTARHDWEILWRMQQLFLARWWVRFSRKDSMSMLTAVETPNSRSITCPQQTGKTASCLTCGLCWSIHRPIHFLTH